MGKATWDRRGMGLLGKQLSPEGPVMKWTPRRPPPPPSPPPPQPCFTSPSKRALPESCEEQGGLRPWKTSAGEGPSDPSDVSPGFIRPGDLLLIGEE